MSLKDKIPGMGSGEDAQDNEELDLDDDDEEVEVGDELDDIDDMNKQLVSAEFTNEKRNRMMVGGQWTRTFFTNNWPDMPENQFLNTPFNKPSAHNDISIHIDPRDEDAAISELKEIRDDLRRQMGADSDFVTAQDRQEKLSKVENMIEVLRSSQTDMFDVGMYTTVRADVEKDQQQRDLEDYSDSLRTQLENAPALTDQTIPIYAQEDALKSVSPIARDFMKENDNFDTRTKMMSGAIAAMLPFTSKTIIEPEGVEFGIHAANHSPVLVDRWGRGNGYNQLTIGKIGAGKSFSTKLNLLRTYAAHDDVVIFMLDPLKGFTNIQEHLQGEHIPVGGGRTLNPLEISSPDNPDEVRGEADPFGQKIKSVKGFIRTFMRERNKEIGGEMEIITAALREAYERNDIYPDDLESHNNESPTLVDVIEILREMADEPKRFTQTENPNEIDKVQNGASDAVWKLQEFLPGGELDYLSGETEIDLSDNDVVYLDLEQQEGSGDLGLMMQVLFEQVYQRAKETDKKVLFCIDEAHYIMDSDESLSFLSQAVRHSRHYDLSLNFITQTAREFLKNEKAEDIASNCTILLLHKTPSLDSSAAKKLGLNQPAMQYVRSAQEGDPEVGYSGALLGVEEDFVPIQVHAGDFEGMLVEMDSEEIAEQL